MKGQPTLRRLLLLFLCLAGGNALADDIFTRRPARVALADGSQSDEDPLYFREWPFGQSVPVTPPRSSFQSGVNEALALWVPTYEGGTSTASFSYFAEGLPLVEAGAGTIRFELYRRLNGLTGDAITGPEEQAYWIGLLEPGEYAVEFNLLELPPLPDGPTTTPWQAGVPQATLVESAAWTFLVVPEPGSLGLFVGMGVAMGLRTVRPTSAV